MVELERTVQTNDLATFTLTSLVAVGLLRMDKMSPSLFATSRRHASFQSS